jgi:GH35 family endo-1,4-beta-xylanase
MSKITIDHKVEGDLVTAEDVNEIARGIGVSVEYKALTNSQWATQNPKLAEGTLGIVKGSNPLKYKFFDGINAWNDIPFKEPIYRDEVKGPVNLTDFDNAVGNFNFQTGLGYDCSNAIQMAMDACSKPIIRIPLDTVGPSGKKNYFEYIAPDVYNYIYVPYGQYRFTRKFEVPPYIRFVGCSAANYITNQKQGSVFVADGVAGDCFASASVKFSDGLVHSDAFVTAADIDQGGYTYVPNMEFERICFMDNPHNPVIPMSYIKMSGAPNSKVLDCTLIGSKFGMITNTSWSWNIRDNVIVPLVCGIVLTESITTGSLMHNEVNGSLMMTYTPDNLLPYGFAPNSGTWYAGKTCGIYQAHSNVEFKNNIVQFGMYYGVISESSGGTIDNTYIEGLAAGGCAYGQKLSAYMKYIVGETSLSPDARLFDFIDFARSEVHFNSNVCNYSNFGNVHPSCVISLYQFRNPGVVLPKGVTQKDLFASDFVGNLSDVLNMRIDKHFTLTGDCTLSADVNVWGNKIILENGRAVPTTVTITAKSFFFAKEVEFRNLNIRVSTDGAMIPVNGSYRFKFIDCTVDEISGATFSNLNAFTGQENDIEVIFENTPVTSSTQGPKNLIGNLSTQWAKLNFKIRKYNSPFTNVYVPADNISLSIMELTGEPTGKIQAQGASWGGGRLLTPDPTFKAGMNGITAYNNLANTNVSVTRVATNSAPSPSPFDSPFILKITNSGPAAPDNGGFKFATPTRANAVFRTRIHALLPIGCRLSLSTNQYGTGGTTFFNTSREGTGKWEEYIVTVSCGSTGTFETTNLFSIIGPANQNVYVDFAGVYDMTGLGGSSSTPIEGDVTGVIANGKVSAADGSFANDTAHKVTDFIPVKPGSRIRVTFATGPFNSIAPIQGTGLEGYASADIGTFVKTILSAEVHNAEAGTQLQDPVKFVDEIRTIPAGVNFIRVPNFIAAGLTLKVIMLQDVGVLNDTISQLYTRIDELTVLTNSGGGGSGSAGSANFTQAEKDKLASIRTPVVNWEGNGQVWTHDETGLQYRGVLRGSPPELQWLPLINTLKNFNPYPVGFAIDWDKMSDPQYAAVVVESTILTPENAFLQGHLNPSLVAGATKYIPNQNTLKWDFVEADKICDYAIQQGIKQIHANHLTWHSGVNSHVSQIVTDNPGNEKAMLTAYLKEYIAAAMAHFVIKYPGLITAWNCMNESICASKTGQVGGAPKPSIWADWFTLDEMFEITFTAARTADPNCKLFYNDYDLETSNTLQADKLIQCITTLAAKNIIAGGKQVKVDGVGFQFHTVVGQDLNAARLKMKRFGDMPDMLVAITECDAEYVGDVYTDAMAEIQAQFFYDIGLNYQRAIPEGQRWAFMYWTLTDKDFIKNRGKNPPGDPVNPVRNFPALYNYYGVKKPAYFRFLSLADLTVNPADVFQDFIETGPLDPIIGSMTDGKTPLVWSAEGYTGGIVGISTLGLRAAQNSTNVNQFAILNYPYPNRYIKFKIAGITNAGSRTCMGVGRYLNTNNYIAAAAANNPDAWVIWKRSNATGSTVEGPIFTSNVKPKVGDIVRLDMNGPTLTLTVNGAVLGTVNDTEFMTATKEGFNMKGYNDKFTIFEYIESSKL